MFDFLKFEKNGTCLRMACKEMQHNKWRKQHRRNTRILFNFGYGKLLLRRARVQITGTSSSQWPASQPTAKPYAGWVEGDGWVLVECVGGKSAAAANMRDAWPSCTSPSSTWLSFPSSGKPAPRARWAPGPPLRHLGPLLNGRGEGPRTSFMKRFLT